MSVIKSLKRAVASFIPSPIKVDFKKGGSKQIINVATYPKEVYWDNTVTIHQTKDGVEYVRTPDERFENLENYDFESRFIEIDGMRMHYLDEGPRDGEIILMLHGQPVWSYLYRKMIVDLSAKGYRCIAPDMIGMGKSDKPIKEKYHTYDKHCALMLSFIKNMKLEKITLFIQDWGSVIGTRLVGENSELFSRMILANGDLPLSTEKTNVLYIPNPVVVMPEIKSIKNAAKYFLMGFPHSFQAWILFCLENTRNFVGEVMQMMTVNKLTHGEVAAYEAPFPSFIYMAGPRTLPCMSAGIVGQQLQAWENLKSFKKPFLSLIGLKDGLLGRPSIQKKWVEAIPGAKGQNHEQFANANHFIQDDIGEIMADRTHKFIQKNPLK